MITWARSTVAKSRMQTTAPSWLRWCLLRRHFRGVKMSNKSRPSRRGFIRQLLLANESIVPAAGERTLVCIFLRGAADTLNMVVPYGDDQYYKSRPTLAIPAPAANKENDIASLRLDD